MKLGLHKGAILGGAYQRTKVMPLNSLLPSRLPAGSQAQHLLTSSVYGLGSKLAVFFHRTSLEPATAFKVLYHLCTLCILVDTNLPLNLSSAGPRLVRTSSSVTNMHLLQTFQLFTVLASHAEVEVGYDLPEICAWGSRLGRSDCGACHISLKKRGQLVSAFSQLGFVVALGAKIRGGTHQTPNQYGGLIGLGLEGVDISVRAASSWKGQVEHLRGFYRSSEKEESEEQWSSHSPLIKPSSRLVALMTCRSMCLISFSKANPALNLGRLRVDHSKEAGRGFPPSISSSSSHLAAFHDNGCMDCNLRGHSKPSVRVRGGFDIYPLCIFGSVSSSILQTPRIMVRRGAATEFATRSTPDLS